MHKHELNVNKNMKFQHISVLTGLMAAGVLALSTSSAQAFSFTTNSTYNNKPKDDIWLKSVQMKDGTIIDDFALVNKANIIYNDAYKGKNSGAASADKGDNAQGVVAEDPNNQQVVAALGNLNLNNIIDGEDSGKFIINLFFDQAVDKLFFWERGMNSDLAVQAIDADGNVIGNLLKILRSEWDDASYKIDTMEISGSQKVGSRGVSLADLGLSGYSSITGIRVSADKSFNGPDFKVVGAVAQSVPEPASLLGLGLMGGMLVVSRRRQATNNG